MWALLGVRQVAEICSTQCLSPGVPVLSTLRCGREDCLREDYPKAYNNMNRKSCENTGQGGINTSPCGNPGLPRGPSTHFPPASNSQCSS